MTKLFFILALVFFSSCYSIGFDAPVPSLYWELFESPGAKSLSSTTRNSMEGIYRIKVADDDFGDSVAVKWTYDITGKDTGYYISFFCKEDVRFFIMQGKSLGDSILLNGYWRNVENTKIGKAHFIISSGNGAAALLMNDSTRQPIFIKGVYGMGDADPDKEVNFQYGRPLHNSTRFQIIAHRGGGRNNDFLPASENSVEMLHLATSMGANGVELDVQLTKDNVPVLYHDARINDRLTNKTGIHGPVHDYTYDELTDEIELKRGGKIPTLREALFTVVYNTPLEFVWLDCKTEGSLQDIKSLQGEFMQKAKTAGRKLEIVIGVPDKDVLQNFLSLPGWQNIPSLCELEQDSTLKMNAKIWATSWSKGLQTQEVAAMQAKGLQVFVWTLDVPRKIREYMREGRFDGIVTNRPSAVAYEYYVRP